MNKGKLVLYSLLILVSYGVSGQTAKKEFNKTMCSAFLKGQKTVFDTSTRKSYNIIEVSSNRFIVKEDENNTGSLLSENELNVADSSNCLCQLEGLSKILFRTGEIYLFQNYSEDYLDGISIEYYKSGPISAIKNFKKGVLNGRYIEYHKNGNLASFGQFEEGYKTGEWRFYDSLGNLSLTGGYTGKALLFKFSEQRDTLYFSNTLTNQKVFAVERAEIDIMLDTIGKKHGYDNFQLPMFLWPFNLPIKQGIWVELNDYRVIRKTLFDPKGRVVSKTDSR